MRKIALSSLLLATLMCVFSMHIAVAADTLAAEEHQIITGPA